MRYRFFLVLGLLLPMVFLNHYSTAAQSNDVIAFWEMDVPPEDGWHVGDLIPLRLRVTSSEDSVVSLPELPAQWGSFEIRDQIKKDVEVSDGKKQMVLEVTAQIWDVGMHETPETVLDVQMERKDSLPITARPLSVEITSVLPAQTDEYSLDKKDLKPQLDLPTPPLWPWLLVALCVSPMLYLAGRWIYSRIFPRRLLNGDEKIIETPDSRFPEDIVYACLERIVRMVLPGIGAYKQHYTMVTDCLRQYILGIYDVPAIDLTTSELKNALQNKRIDSESLSLLWELLDQADMVKFAKFRPDTAHARSIVRWGRHFVDCTKPFRSTTPEETEKME